MAKLPHGARRQPYGCIVTPTRFDVDGRAHEPNGNPRPKGWAGWPGDKLRRKAIRGKL
jgi:hypothetical protein